MYIYNSVFISITVYMNVKHNLLLISDSSTEEALAKVKAAEVFKNAHPEVGKVQLLNWLG